MKQIRLFFEKQGFFILLVVCIGVIVGSGIWAYAMRDNDAAETTDAASDTAQSLADAEALRMAAPLSGEIIQAYAQIDWLETLACWGAHEAIDIAADKGADVTAAKAGTVESASRDGLWGGVVEITHASGVVTRYSGLAWPVQVSAGDTVEAGQAIGKVGAAAIESGSSAHLHFEVKKDGVPINPAMYID